MDLEYRDDSYFKSLINHLEPREWLIVDEVAEVPRAWGILKKYSPKKGYQFAGETSVFVHSEFRGQGIGKSIKHNLILKAKALQYKHLVARIWSNNDTSIAYNLKLGYEIVGIQNKIGYVDQQWIDVVVMQLVLE